MPSPKTKKQREFINTIATKTMVMATGPAGTGKTYLTAAYAAYEYAHKNIQKIILTRPTVPVSRTIGHLPGTLEEKMAPWAVPFIEVLKSILTVGEVDYMVKHNRLEIIPFETIRGRTFDNSFIVLDEAQNATIEEAKAFVTRIGEHSKIVINGDESQSDLKQKSGLSYLIYLLSDVNNEALADKVGLIEFSSDDIVRSGLTKLWVKAFENDK